MAELKKLQQIRELALNAISLHKKLETDYENCKKKGKRLEIEVKERKAPIFDKVINPNSGYKIGITGKIFKDLIATGKCKFNKEKGTLDKVSATAKSVRIVAKPKKVKATANKKATSKAKSKSVNFDVEDDLSRRLDALNKKEKLADKLIAGVKKTKKNAGIDTKELYNAYEKAKKKSGTTVDLYDAFERAKREENRYGESKRTRQPTKRQLLDARNAKKAKDIFNYDFADVNEDELKQEEIQRKREAEFKEQFYPEDIIRGETFNYPGFDRSTKGPMKEAKKTTKKKKYVEKKRPAYVEPEVETFNYPGFDVPTPKKRPNKKSIKKQRKFTTKGKGIKIPKRKPKFTILKKGGMVMEERSKKFVTQR
jgi:hypothetical protein